MRPDDGMGAAWRGVRRLAVFLVVAVALIAALDELEILAGLSGGWLAFMNIPIGFVGSFLLVQSFGVFDRFGL